MDKQATSGFVELTGFISNCQVWKAYVLHQTDHLMAFSSSQDIKLKMFLMYDTLLHAPSNEIP